MSGKWTQHTMVGLTVLALSGGCASKDKSRISMLEDANRNHSHGADGFMTFATGWREPVKVRLPKRNRGSPWTQ